MNHGVEPSSELSPVAAAALRTIEGYGLFGPNSRILVAVSGGADSTCLCRVLAELAPSLRLTVSAAYVNHGLRPEENEREMAFCRELCARLGLDFFVEDAPVEKHPRGAGNLQDRARQDRHAVLEHRRQAVGADKIAFGHTMDDQAETVVMRFIRGSGSRGLSGIPVQRGRIVRPLIGVRRTEVESYLKDLGQSWCEDSSNRSARYQRNRLRAELMPLLEQENPRIVETLARTAQRSVEEDAYLTAETRRLLKNLVATRSPSEVELKGRAFDEVPPVLRRRIVRIVAEDLGGGYGPGSLHTEQVLTTLSSGGRALFPNRVIAERSGDCIRFSSGDAHEGAGSFETTLNVPGVVALPDGTTLSAVIAPFDGDYGDGRTKAVFDSGKIIFPLTVRSRRPGDRMRPFGVDGWKKVQDILTDAKVPRFRRNSIPVVTTRDGEILWVIGLRLDGRYRWEDSTGEVLVIAVVS